MVLHTKYCKSNRERKTSYDIIQMWTLSEKKKKLANLWLPKENIAGAGAGRLIRSLE